jgi:hypothetical protein
VPVGTRLSRSSRPLTILRARRSGRLDWMMRPHMLDLPVGEDCCRGAAGARGSRGHPTNI